MCNLAPLWDWMIQRHALYLEKRDGRPTDITVDPILRQYRFCNVFRELDRVTVWVREHIREPYADHPNLWFMLAIARQINWPDTLGELMIGTSPQDGRSSWPFVREFEPRALGDVLDARRARGDKVYTGAYMIRAESDKTKEWFNWTKQQYMAQIVLGKVWEAQDSFNGMFWADHYGDSAERAQPSLQKVHNWLMQFHGWGPFMAYEVVTDLRWTRYLREAPDIMTWANAGPGAFRGLNRLFGRPLDKPVGQERACEEMGQLLALANKALPDWVRFVDHRGVEHPLEMRDIEHSLCEVDKWLRVRNGEGRPRALYVAGRGW